ncbi:ExsB [Planoprotostelium fungivorum]|uniref:ExsB n=1 Tax=Planoprotostelium fungivorum TaxID=1890364 RepID=A0A2P6NVP1_9EUKA|nr:ExsB [Planoprotostelium fungivorum]
MVLQRAPQQAILAGTRVELWLPPGIQSNCYGYDVPDYSSLYNTRIAPYMPQRISTAICYGSYQGESNVLAAGVYNCLLANLVRSWRANFGYNDSLPWFIVQLAGYSSGWHAPIGGSDQRVDNGGLDDLRYFIYNSVCSWKLLNNCNPALNITLTVSRSLSTCGIWSLNLIVSLPRLQPPR